MVQTPDKDDPWEASFGTLSDMSHWEEAWRLTQDVLEGLYLLAGLGELRNPPRGAGTCCRNAELEHCGKIVNQRWSMEREMRSEGKHHYL